MPDIEIRLKITEHGIEIFDQAGKQLEDFGRKAADAEQGGLRKLSQGMADIKSTWDLASGTFSTIAQIALDLNAAGVAGMRAAAGFEALGGQENTIKRMMETTRSLVDDELLMGEATTLMSSKIMESADDLEEFARIGATLGITFKGNATAGVMAFGDALQGVGNIRALRQLGIDTLAVSEKFELLKKSMSDASAWKMAVLDVAGESADKLAGALDSTGTAWERMQNRFQMGKGALEEWVSNGIESAVTSLEKLEGIWNKLQTNPNLTLTLTMNAVNDEATNSLNNTNDALTKWLNNAAANMMDGAGMQVGAGNSPKNQVIPLTSQMEQEAYGPPKEFAPKSDSQYRNSALQMLNEAGKRQRQEAYMNEILDAHMPDSEINQRRRRADPLNTADMMSKALEDQYVKPYEAAHQQAKELRIIQEFWKGIGDAAGDYNTKLQGALAPLYEQQRIMERRKAIQSIDDAFGVEGQDGLFGDVGSGMAGSIATRRDKLSTQLKRKIGTYSGGYKLASADQITAFDEQTKAERDAYLQSLDGEQASAEELYRGGDWKADRVKSFDRARQRRRSTTLRQGRGEAYTQADYEEDMADYDEGAKSATDAYAIATGAATEESIKFRDIIGDVNKAFEDGKIGVDEYKSQMLALGGAAKSGATSMEDLERITTKISFRTALSDGLENGKLKGPQKGAATRYLATTKGTDGDNAQGDGGMFDSIIDSANKANSAVAQIGAQGAVAIGVVAVGATLAATQMGGLVTQTTSARDMLKELKTEINMLASLTITINKTTQSGGSSGGSRGVGGVSSPR